MKNTVISLALIFTSIMSYSQIGFGVGYESSGDNELNSAIKVNIESLSINNINYNGFILGLDFGINFINNDKKLMSVIFPPLIPLESILIFLIIL